MIVVEVALPWPKPVFEHKLLAGAKRAADSAQLSTRVLAAVPNRLRSGTHASEIVQYVRQPDGRVQRNAWEFAPVDTAAALGAVLAGQTDELIASPLPPPSAEVWVCTQGSHDMCCGADGTRLVNDIEDRWSDVVVRRVSHTGGHRFAPTAMTMPDGRMWAYLDPDGLEKVLRRDPDHASVADRCRGWWGAATGPAQVAECAVFARTGWTWETAPREATVVAHDDVNNISTVEVAAGSRGPDGKAVASWLVEVAIGREVPSIACRAPGGLPAKPGVEYRVESLVAQE